MVSANFNEEFRSNARYVALAQTGDEDLGPLKLLPGTWRNTDALNGRGWNMIALPFAQSGSFLNYRLLMNQFNEELKFTLVDKGVPNRGIDDATPATNTDQLVVTLDYEQMITQISAKDSPDSGLAGDPDLAIHHEPGLWLNMTNLTTNGFDVARLATVPHGDAALALGDSEVIDGKPTIPDISGMPIGAPTDINHPYLAPYKVFADAPFKGVLDGVAAFPGFSPVTPNGLLIGGIPDNVLRTTILKVDTDVEQAGIRNIPFIVKQANAVKMSSTFWIMELDESNADGSPRIMMMYSQDVSLDFFKRRDGTPGLIRWPHVSINVMEKVAEPDLSKAEMPSIS